METTNETDEVRDHGATDAGGQQNASIRQEYGFAPDVKLKECRFCCVMIPKQAKICPNCKKKLKRHWFLKSTAALLATAVIGVGGFWLSAYWGLIDESRVPVWMTRSMELLPSVSVVVEPTQAGAGVAAAGEAETVERRAPETGAEEAAQQTAEPSVEKAAGEIRPTVNAPADGSLWTTAGTADSVVESDIIQQTEKEPEKDGASSAVDKGTARDDGDERVSQPGEMPEEQNETADMLVRADTDDDMVQEEDKTERSEKIDANEAAFRAECVQVDYRTLLREKEDYLDEAVMMEVQVVRQLDGGLFDENIYYLCMMEETGGIVRYYIVRDDRETDDTLILEGDMIAVYGRLFGDCKIPAGVIEARPTVPAVSMSYCDLR